MWYSTTKVGIMDIDMDHSNVDTMLQLYFHEQVPQNFIVNIVEGLIKHFTHEEEIVEKMGFDFPRDHRDEHERLTKVLLERVDDWNAGSVGGKDLAEEIRSVLLLHVAEFDIKLADVCQLHKT